VDGRHIDVLGTLEDVAGKLSPEACSRHHGFCEISDPQGHAMLINRDHVLYLERRGRR
jgi:hypothetical protein